MISRLQSQLPSHPSTMATNHLHFATRLPKCVVETFVQHFSHQPGPTASWPMAGFDNEQGVGDSVTREAFSLFWDAVVGCMFISKGGDLSLPVLSPTYNTQHWEVMGRILAYTVAVLGLFPLGCISQVVCCALFDIQPDEEVLVNDFLSTLEDRTRGRLEPLFFYKEEELRRFVSENRQDILELLAHFDVSFLPRSSEIRPLLVNIAKYSLLEGPRAALTAMQSGFQSISGSAFSGITGAMISEWYQQQQCPIFEKISTRLQMESDEEGASRVFNVLMDFLREHRTDEGLLRKFLRYTTGSSNARGDVIKVDIKRNHSAVTHETCFSIIRLPLICDDREAEKAFVNDLMSVLTNSVVWTFNRV